jgi:hypothetical protein
MLCVTEIFILSDISGLVVGRGSHVPYWCDREEGHYLHPRARVAGLGDFIQDFGGGGAVLSSGSVSFCCGSER